MELEESYQACPFCGIGFTNFEFHLNVHEDCKLLDDQSKQLGKRREEMKGLNEALDFIDSRLLQHFHEEAEEEDVVKVFVHNEVASEKIVVKDELEIGETKFLEQGPVSYEERPDYMTDPLDDTAVSKLKREMLASNKLKREMLASNKLKRETQTDVKTQASKPAGLLGGRIKKPFCNGGEQPSEIFYDQPSGPKVETVEDAPQGSSLAKLKYSDAGRFEVAKFNSDETSSKGNEVLKEEVEVGKVEVGKVEVGVGKEPDKRTTLFLTTASESSGNSRTFSLKVKPECNLGKVRSSVARFLKVDPERIVLT